MKEFHWGNRDILRPATRRDKGLAFVDAVNCADAFKNRFFSVQNARRAESAPSSLGGKKGQVSLSSCNNRGVAVIRQADEAGARD